MSTPPTQLADPTIGPAKRRVPALGSLQGYIGLALVILAGIITKGGDFANTTNLTNAIGYFAPRGILAVGMTLVIIAAGIDLSVGSLMAIGGTAAAWLLTTANWPTIAIVPATMAICAVFGFINGAGTALLKIQSFVMTLAMMTIARGIVREFSGNQSISTQVYGPNGMAPGSVQFGKLGTPGTQLFDVPIIGYFPVLALLVVVIVFQLILSKTKFGRHIYAVGGNPTAARLSGVNVTGVTIAVFTLSGMLAGLAGPINAAYNASAFPEAGISYELDAIAAVVIGGASLAGGRGNVIGTFIGALILTLLDNVLGLNNFSANWQLIIKGVIVVVAVVIQRPELFSDLAARFRGSRGRPGPSAPGAVDTSSHAGPPTETPRSTEPSTTEPSTHQPSTHQPSTTKPSTTKE